MFNDSGIYKILNTLNGKYYVGSSQNMTGCDGRKTQHFRQLRKNEHPNEHLQNAYNLYGEEYFDFLILENNVKPSNLLEKEQVYLDVVKDNKALAYNKSYIAGKIDFTDEIRQKMSIARQGKYFSENNNAYKPISEEIKEEIKNIWVLEGYTTASRLLENKYGAGIYVFKRLLKEFKSDKISVINQRINMYKKRTQTFEDNSGALIKCGEKNNRYNPTIHNLINIVTNESFSGTINEFTKKYNIDNISQVTRGVKKTRYGWRLLETVLVVDATV